jgi:hypothetical protein
MASPFGTVYRSGLRRAPQGRGRGLFGGWWVLPPNSPLPCVSMVLYGSLTRRLPPKEPPL